MNRIVASVSLVLASGLVAAACSRPRVPFDLRTCALVSACSRSGPSFGGIGLLCEALQLDDAASSAVLDSTNAISISRLQCIADATTCTALTACLSATAAEAAVCAGGSVFKCSGNVIVQCDGTPTPNTVDCASHGLKCIEGSGDALCSSGTCDPTTTEPFCEGDSLVQCHSFGGTSGALVPTDCKNRMGEECSSGNGPGNTCTALISDTCAVVSGTAQCAGSGAGCDFGTTNTCTGTVITACVAGQLAQFDCASLGVPVTCKLDSGGGATCVGAGTECDETTPETCAGGVIGYCTWGTKTTLDCKSYGFSGCTTQGSGTDTFARCVQ